MKANFFLYAVDETRMWQELPTGVTKAFGIYLVCDGEATHVCSLTPSSRADFIENEFVGVNYYDMPGLTQEWVDEQRYSDGGEACTYFGFIDRELVPTQCSELREIEVDDEDFEHLPEEVRADAVRSALWDEAREDFQSNCASIPCVGDGRGSHG